MQTELAEAPSKKENLESKKHEQEKDSSLNLLALCQGKSIVDCVASLDPKSKAAHDNQLLDEIEKAHFNYFVDQSDPLTGLTKDRSTKDSPASIAAVGFSLSSYPIAVERGWIDREKAADYTLKVLRTLWNAPQSDAAEGQSGYKGFFYHFLDPKDGSRAWKSELSTIDTALLMSGVLFSKNYFDADTAKENEIRQLADKLYLRVDWDWALNKDRRVSMGWFPESGFITHDWHGYNEAMILILLGMGSPTNPLPKDSWDNYHASSKTMNYGGQDYIGFRPHFGHQYSHAWVDFRGITDKQNKALGYDYFENSRRATYAQNYYAIQNPLGFKGYSKLDWGLTASDGPGQAFNGSNGKFHSYIARGAPTGIDDGTIAPTAAAASLPFAPELVMPTLYHWRYNRPELWTNNGFKDAFNPSADPSKPSGWVGKDMIGIDQGPIVLMTENHRSGMVWDLMKKDPYLVDGLKKAGFTGGWLK